MKGILFALCALLVGCDSGQNPVAVPITTSYAVPNPPVVQAKLIVFMGDSITAYWPVDSYFPGSVDEGIGGQVTAQMLARFDTDVLSQHPTVVVILGGTNDILNLHVADPVNIFAMVQAAEAAGARVIVGMPPPPPDLPSVTPDDRAMYRQFNDQLAYGAGVYGYQVADYYDAMTLPDGSQNAALFQTGSVHPNSAGYDVMASVLRPLLQAD